MLWDLVVMYNQSWVKLSLNLGKIPREFAVILLISKKILLTCIINADRNSQRILLKNKGIKTKYNLGVACHAHDVILQSIN
jgi:hypothetical protein